MEDMILHDLYFRIFESAVVAIGVTDRKGLYIEVNNAWCNFMGYTREEALQLNIDDVTPETDIPESKDNYNRLMNHEIDKLNKNKRFKRKNGTLFWTDLSVSAIKNDSGKAVGVLGIFVDIDEKYKTEQYQKDMNSMLEVLNEELMSANTTITKKNVELQAAYKELNKLARRDTLTELYNRRALNEIMEQEVRRSQRSGRPFFVAIADIDNFKHVNDTYGHSFGDLVLKEVAKIIKDGGVRGTDYAGRWGGEEFLLILTETKYNGAYTVLERIRKSVCEHKMQCGEVSINVTVTIGFTYQKEHYNSLQLLEEADKALYIGKRSGKNKTVCHFDCSAT
ncbi:MAG: sensor domain-containing diguanylate cyclase [Candidatus Cloacimonadaceae bacterium]|nr:sensor domain-containing diguanylate cyclase [Candidatus Cloacimonadaceae bacterium]